jgi:hypothetical protein
MKTLSELLKLNASAIKTELIKMTADQIAKIVCEIEDTNQDEPKVDLVYQIIDEEGLNVCDDYDDYDEVSIAFASASY